MNKTHVPVFANGGSLRMSVRSEVIALFQQLAEEHNRELAPLADDLPLLERRAFGGRHYRFQR